MKVWILTKRENFECHENLRFKEVAEQMSIELTFVSPEEFELIVTKEGRKSILRNNKTVELPDCLIPRMGCGSTYFALAIIRQFEHLGVLVLNKSKGIEISKDKLETMQRLVTNNIPIPKSMLAKFPLDMTVVDKEFTYPLILKPVSGSYGKGIFLCENIDQLTDLAEMMEFFKDPNVNVIIQEFVSGSRGKDVRVLVVGGRPIGAMLRTAAEGKFKANYTTGGQIELFELNQAIEQLSVECAKLLELEIAGVDILFDGDHYRICEVNSSPGFNGFEKATGINIPKEIFNYARLCLSGQAPEKSQD